jgi:hypothetical protein
MELYRAKVKTPTGERHLMGLHAVSDAGVNRAEQALRNVSFIGAESTVTQGKWVVARVAADTKTSSVGFYVSMHGDHVEQPIGGVLKLEREQLHDYLGETGANKLLDLDLASTTSQQIAPLETS